MKKPVTTRRGQHHKNKSFRIKLVKDAEMNKIDSNILRNYPHLFEKKLVTFEKKNSDPKYFQEKIWKEFPSLTGKDFSLFRLGRTNSKEVKTKLLSLPSEIDNASALCECEELNRSQLYIKEATQKQDISSSHYENSGNHDSGQSDVPDDDDDDDDENDAVLLRRAEMTDEPVMQYSGTQNPLYEGQMVTVSKTQDGDPWVSMFVSPVIGENNQLMFLPQPNPPLQNQTQSSSQEYATLERYQQNGDRGVNSSSIIQPPYNSYTGKRPSGDGYIAHKKFRPEFDSDRMFGSTHEKNGLMADEATAAVANVERSHDHHSDNTSHNAIEGQPTSYLNMLQDNYGINGRVDPGGPVGFNPGYQGNTEYHGNVQTLQSVVDTHFNNAITSHMVSTYPGFNLIPTTQYNLPVSVANAVVSTDNTPNNSSSSTGALQHHLLGMIENHHRFLVEHLDPDFGLLDALIASGSLTMEEYHNIRLTPSTIEDRNKKLLRYVTEKNVTDQLMFSLKEVNQNHVVNYLMSDAKYSEGYGEDWPLEASDIRKLMRHRREVIEQLDVSTLCVVLSYKRIIRGNQLDLINSKQTRSEKNEILLEILMRCSERQYREVTRVLRELKLNSVAELLELDPKRIGAIDFGSNDDVICGLTILDDDLFIAKECKSEIDVYHSTIFHRQRTLGIDSRVVPVALGSCAIKKCLYILDNNDTDNSVVRLSPNGDVLKQWKPKENGEISDLSVTFNSNVLLTFKDKYHFSEYSGEGDFLHKIDLRSSILGKNFRVLHAIKTRDNDYLISVSHSPKQILGVDAKGNIHKTFSIDADVRDLYFTVDREKCPLVVDQKEKRILSLRPDLKDQRDILTAEKHKLQTPQRICLDESNNHLFVLNYDDSKKSSEVLVFAV